MRCHTYCPRTNEALLALVDQCIAKDGPDCSLNHIDVSCIQDFSNLFMGRHFCGDISLWNVANAVAMDRMFMSSTFNGNISGWTPLRVVSMSHMFEGGQFNGNLSGWYTPALKNAAGMVTNLRSSGEALCMPPAVRHYMLQTAFSWQDADKRRWLAHSPLRVHQWDELLHFPTVAWATPQMRALLQEHRLALDTVCMDAWQKGQFLHEAWNRLHAHMATEHFDVGALFESAQ